MGSPSPDDGGGEWTVALAAPEQERSATWLELFFDLIFVINVAGLTHHLVAHPGLHALGQVAVLYVPLFLVWAGHTTYATRFDDGSNLQTILTLLLMFMLAGSAVFVQSGMDPHAPSFARVQAGARLVLVLLYLEALVRVPAARRFSGLLLAAFALSALAWGAHGLVPDTWRPWLYGAAAVLDLLVPLLAASRFGRWPAHPSHLPERLGLFTIIVLGEAVLGIVVGAAHLVGSAPARLTVTMSFALPVGIWWFYFRLLDRAELRPRVGVGQLLTYLHLPMTFAVMVMAAAVEVSLSGFNTHGDGGGAGLLEAARHAIGGAGGREVGPALPGVRLLFGGLALWLACFLALRVVVVGLRRLGAAGWATAGVVAALALGAALLGPVRATELFIFAGSLLLALAALGSLLKELHQRRSASRKQRRS